MAPHNVRVSFDLVTQQFGFVPKRTPVGHDQSATIVFLREPPNNPGWEFADVEFKNDPDNEFTKVSVTDQAIVVRDRNSKKGEYTYEYKVTVRFNGREYPSPDPEIVNSGPKTMMLGGGILPVVALVVGAIVGALIDMNTGSLESRGPFKGAIVGAIIGAAVGYALSRRRRP